MLGGNRQSRDAQVTKLIARRKYDRAIDLIREALAERRRDTRLRLRLADVLVMAGRQADAVALLEETADDLALSGAAAQAIAALKRVEALAPGNESIGEKLAYLIAQQERPTPDPWQRARTAIRSTEAASAPPPAPTNASGPFPGDMEEIPEADVGGRSDDGAALPSTEHDESGDSGVQPEALGRDEVPTADELLALIEDVFAPGTVTVVAGDPGAVPAASASTPLFRDFGPEELVEVIRGLRLRRFDAGEIVVSEGEPGDSLFLLTTGMARTYMKNASGRNALVRELAEGDVFGEVSLLSGAARSATVTAASFCELLEIDRPTLDDIAQRHPRVWSVLKGFYDERVRSEQETRARQSD